VNKRQIDLSVTLRALRLLQSLPLVRSPAPGGGVCWRRSACSWRNMTRLCVRD